MPQHRPLEPASPWVEVVATDDDWDAADASLELGTTPEGAA